MNDTAINNLIFLFFSGVDYVGLNLSEADDIVLEFFAFLDENGLEIKEKNV